MADTKALGALQIVEPAEVIQGRIKDYLLARSVERKYTAAAVPKDDYKTQRLPQFVQTLLSDKGKTGKFDFSATLIRFAYLDEKADWSDAKVQHFVLRCQNRKSENFDDVWEHIPTIQGAQATNATAVRLAVLVAQYDYLWTKWLAKAAESKLTKSNTLIQRLSDQKTDKLKIDTVMDEAEQEHDAGDYSEWCSFAPDRYVRADMSALSAIAILMAYQAELVAVWQDERNKRAVTSLAELTTPNFITDAMIGEMQEYAKKVLGGTVEVIDTEVLNDTPTTFKNALVYALVYGLCADREGRDDPADIAVYQERQIDRRGWNRFLYSLFWICTNTPALRLVKFGPEPAELHPEPEPVGLYPEPEPVRLYPELPSESEVADALLSVQKSLAAGQPEGDEEAAGAEGDGGEEEDGKEAVGAEGDGGEEDGKEAVSAEGDGGEEDGKEAVSAEGDGDEENDEEDDEEEEDEEEEGNEEGSTGDEGRVEGIDESSLSLVPTPLKEPKSAGSGFSRYLGLTNPLPIISRIAESLYRTAGFSQLDTTAKNLAAILKVQESGLAAARPVIMDSASSSFSVPFSESSSSSSSFSEPSSASSLRVSHPTQTPASSSSASSLRVSHPKTEPASSSSVSSLRVLHPKTEPASSSSASSLRVSHPTQTPASSSSASSLRVLHPKTEPASSSSVSSLRVLHPKTEPASSSSASSLRVLHPTQTPASSSSASSLRVLPLTQTPASSSSASSLRVLPLTQTPASSSSSPRISPSVKAPAASSSAPSPGLSASSSSRTSSAKEEPVPSTFSTPRALSLASSLSRPSSTRPPSRTVRFSDTPFSSPAGVPSGGPSDPSPLDYSPVFVSPKQDQPTTDRQELQQLDLQQQQVIQDLYSAEKTALAAQQIARAIEQPSGTHVWEGRQFDLQQIFTLATWGNIRRPQVATAILQSLPVIIDATTDAGAKKLLTNLSAAITLYQQHQLTTGRISEAILARKEKLSNPKPVKKTSVRSSRKKTGTIHSAPSPPTTSAGSAGGADDAGPPAPNSPEAFLDTTGWDQEGEARVIHLSSSPNQDLKTISQRADDSAFNPVGVAGGAARIPSPTAPAGVAGGAARIPSPTAPVSVAGGAARVVRSPAGVAGDLVQEVQADGVGDLVQEVQADGVGDLVQEVQADGANVADPVQDLADGANVADPVPVDLADGANVADPVPVDLADGANVAGPIPDLADGANVADGAVIVGSGKDTTIFSLDAAADEEAQLQQALAQEQQRVQDELSKTMKNIKGLTADFSPKFNDDPRDPTKFLQSFVDTWADDLQDTLATGLPILEALIPRAADNALAKDLKTLGDRITSYIELLKRQNNLDERQKAFGKKKTRGNQLKRPIKDLLSKLVPGIPTRTPIFLDALQKNLDVYALAGVPSMNVRQNATVQEECETAVLLWRWRGLARLQEPADTTVSESCWTKFRQALLADPGEAACEVLARLPAGTWDSVRQPVPFLADQELVSTQLESIVRVLALDQLVRGQHDVLWPRAVKAKLLFTVQDLLFSGAIGAPLSKGLCRLFPQQSDREELFLNYGRAPPTQRDRQFFRQYELSTLPKQKSEYAEIRVDSSTTEWHLSCSLGGTRKDFASTAPKGDIDLGALPPWIRGVIDQHEAVWLTWPLPPSDPPGKYDALWECIAQGIRAIATVKLIACEFTGGDEGLIQNFVTGFSADFNLAEQITSPHPLLLATRRLRPKQEKLVLLSRETFTPYVHQLRTEQLSL